MLLYAFAAVLAAAGETEYQWPLELPRALTSSFAEYRAGRFHMGIDLRTGPIGQPVHAADEGFVERVRCSPYGYGKAVYLRLRDGNSVVYGHLDDYNDELRAFVRAEQHHQESYTVDVTPAAGQFPVTRGQLIAFSGQTGIGVPHLHYEIRNAAGEPINPRLIGVTWPDSTPPLIRKIAVAPASPNATVDGDYLPVVLDVARQPDGSFRTRPIRANGPIVFSVDVVDPANNGDSRLGIHTLAAEFGGIEIFSIVHDRVSYDHGQDGGVAYHPYLLDEGRFLTLFRWPGNRTYIYSVSNGDGRWPAQSGEVHVNATDFWDNAVSVVVPIEAAEIAPPPAPSSQNSTGQSDIDCFADWLVISARFSAAEETPPTVVLSGDENGPLPMNRVDAKTFRLAYAPAAGARRVVIDVEHPRIASNPREFFITHRGDSEASAELRGLQVRVSPDSPYGTLFVRVYNKDEAAGPGLKRIGDVYAAWPSAAPIDAPVELSFPFPAGAKNESRVAAYRRSGSAWSWAGGERRGDRLVVQTGSLGAYALHEDTAPPVITVESPNEGPASKGPRPRIRARIADEGSGVADFKITCNGEWLLAEYDPEQGILEWERDTDLPTGVSSLVFYVSDRSGNTSERTLSFVRNAPGSPSDDAD